MHAHQEAAFYVWFLNSMDVRRNCIRRYECNSVYHHRVVLVNQFALLHPQQRICLHRHVNAIQHLIIQDVHVSIAEFLLLI